MRIFILLLLSFSAVLADEIQFPEVKDPQFELSLFAKQPDIVTPIGIAIDKQDRIFVVESHTHRRKEDYPGPKTDRIKIFQDTDGDGTADKISVFAEPPYWCMNLTFFRDELYLSHRYGVVALHDKNNDGVCDGETKLIECITPGDTPHNGIGGIAFGPDGWLYFAMGENRGQPYTIRGSDGLTHSGEGEGGKIFRCQPDGTKMELFARGFWNPFGLEFDRAGHLLCVDNDAHARPPNRFLNVVADGDYGYQFRFASNGIHPFISWNAELPGTLPMICGVGEGAAGVLDGAKVRLPKKYEGAIFGTSWGDNDIEYFLPKPNGASLRAERHVLVQGNEFFRPATLAADSQGSIYFTDWVKREYEVHGYGRIWRLKSVAAVYDRRRNEKKNATGIDRRYSNPAEQRMQNLQQAQSVKKYKSLLTALDDKDPFIFGAAISALSRPVFREKILADAENKNPNVRLGVLLALRRAEFTNAAPLLGKWLTDPEEKVRLMALIWTGEKEIIEVADKINSALSGKTVSPLLFQAYAATSQILAAKTGKNVSADKLLATASPNLKAMILSLSGTRNDEQWLSILRSPSQGDDLNLRLEAIRNLSESTNKTVAKTLQALAFDRRNSEQLRAEAILALASQSAETLAKLIPLLDDSSAVVRLETERVFRGVKDFPAIQSALGKKSLPKNESKPSSFNAWLKILEIPGDASSGRRLFFNPTIGCAKCHHIEGHGGKVGPELSVVGRHHKADRLAASVLTPSRDIAPEYLTYNVETKDGESYSGILSGEGADSLTLALADGRGVVIPLNQIASKQISKLSLMPEGLVNSMTVQDFRDLIAFLQSRK